MIIEDLDELIQFIYNKFDSINTKWREEYDFLDLNMKKKKVIDILLDNDISSIIFNYHNYLFSLYKNLLMETEELKLSNRMELRLKNYNSLQDKVSRYCNSSKHGNGEIPINKCVNDIIGFRLIFEKSVDFTKLREYIKNNYKNLVCLDSSKDGYVATHVYFTKDDNFNFRWELQLWNQEDEKNNKECHEMYKQAYTKYENEIKEDEIYG